MIWLPILLASGVVALVWSKRAKAGTGPAGGGGSGVINRDDIPPVEEWVRVSDGARDWLVAPDYIAPVAIGEAQALAAQLGTVLPSPALVDAIWQAADLKIAPHPMVPNKGDNPGQFAEHAQIVADQILAERPNRDYRLQAGSHKDVVLKNGVLGLYGWHQLNGKPIQGFFAGHAAGYRDYSQGLRLVRPA